MCVNILKKPLTCLGQCTFFKKLLQYFVVPRDVFISIPSILKFGRDLNALNASSIF